MQILLHVANALFLCSFLVKDILWLRVLSILGGIALLFAFWLPAEPLWGTIAWNVLFTVINLVQIYRLVLERRPVRFTSDEQALYQLAFRVLTPREFSRLLRAGTWESADAGARLVAAGADLSRLLVLVSGSASVDVGPRCVAMLRPGQLVGEMSFLTGARPNADVVAKENVRFVAWPKAELSGLLDRHPDVRSALQAVIGSDLAEKLRAV